MTLDLERIQPRRRNAEATRAAILEAAKAQFARAGYDLTSLRDIAAEAGADVALIKRYFGGKEALVHRGAQRVVPAPRPARVGPRGLPARGRRR